MRSTKFVYNRASTFCYSSILVFPTYKFNESCILLYLSAHQHSDKHEGRGRGAASGHRHEKMCATYIELGNAITNDERLVSDEVSRSEKHDEASRLVTRNSTFRGAPLKSSSEPQKFLKGSKLDASFFPHPLLFAYDNLEKVKFTSENF